MPSWQVKPGGRHPAHGPPRSVLRCERLTTSIAAPAHSACCTLPPARLTIAATLPVCAAAISGVKPSDVLASIASGAPACSRDQRCIGGRMAKRHRRSRGATVPASHVQVRRVNVVLACR